MRTLLTLMFFVAYVSPVFFVKANGRVCDEASQPCK